MGWVGGGGGAGKESPYVKYQNHFENIKHSSMAFLLSSKNYMELLLQKDKKEGSDEIGASLHYFLAAARARTMGTIFFILLLCDRTEEMIISDSKI